MGTEFTLEAWAQSNSTSTNQSILSKFAATGNNRSYVLRWSSDRHSLLIDYDGITDNTYNSSGTLGAGTWYYLLVVYNSPNADFYVDGAYKITRATIGGAPFNGTGPFNIGARDNGGSQVFNGAIDEARVSTVVRSAAWISAQHKSMTDVFITFGSAEAQGSAVSYFTPDAAAAGMHGPVT